MDRKEFQKQYEVAVDYFTKAYVEIPPEKQDIGKKIIEQLAFATVNLRILQDDIIENGPVVLFVNGSQEMMRENPAQKSYVAVINRWTGLVKELNNLLPRETLVKVEKNSADEIVALMRGES
ncbi:hypothetical protein KAR50_00135 [Periweissella fabaria]|uniref:Terminase small subunit n=1 Tax=Periweissella fabaria TaxID=546157 RepID=A0ABM8Z819_9LACO|nr:hypothetical protein [Periweissella fabaria]MCM0596269.1 hypothetical protein [Periweissella fabaria]CAH0417479.1 hypothetical protein WFA24289_01820 [Periweissella fabaria]